MRLSLTISVYLISSPFLPQCVHCSLIKMLYWMCDKSQSDPTGRQLEHAIKRNFGGLEEVNAYEIFMKLMPSVYAKVEQDGISEEVRIIFSVSYEANSQ